MSAGRPTKLVRDRGVESYDDPPAPDEPVVLTAPATSTAVPVFAGGEQLDAPWIQPKDAADGLTTIAVEPVAPEASAAEVDRLLQLVRAQRFAEAAALVEGPLKGLCLHAAVVWACVALVQDGKFDLIEEVLVDSLGEAGGGFMGLNQVAYLGAEVAFRETAGARTAMAEAAVAMADEALAALSADPEATGWQRAALQDTAALARVAAGRPEEALELSEQIDVSGLSNSDLAGVVGTRALAEVERGRVRQAKRLRQEMRVLDPEASLLGLVNMAIQQRRPLGVDGVAGLVGGLASCLVLGLVSVNITGGALSPRQFATAMPAFVVIWYLSLLLHELVHVAVARHLGWPVVGVRFNARGAVTTYRVPWRLRPPPVMYWGPVLLTATIAVLAAIGWHSPPTALFGRRVDGRYLAFATLLNASCVLGSALPKGILSRRDGDLVKLWRLRRHPAMGGGSEAR